MDSATISPDPALERQRDAFIERVTGFANGSLTLFAIYIGDRLGLYRALAEGGPATAGELAGRTRTHARYLREWLEQQTVSGVLEVLDERLPADERRYRLPPGHVEPLIECSSLNYIAPLAQLIAGAVTPLAEILEAYRNGGGVAYSLYGKDFREGQAALNYPMFAGQLARDWLPQLPDVHARLQAGSPARVADIGCGFGWSSIAIAKGYSKVLVDGYDLDAASIEQAAVNARLNGVEDRVHFHVRDASDALANGRYDLVTAFECLHDMADPVKVLTSMRRLIGPQGAVLIMDERAGEHFSASSSEVERMLYGWSVLHCLPVGMADSPVNGTGTVMRPETVRRYAAEAGFHQVEELPIENEFFRFYRLYP